MRPPVRRPDLTIATEDHNVPTVDVVPPIADQVSRTQVETLRRNCKEFGVRLHPMNDVEQGIVHVVGPQLGLTQPGMTVVWRHPYFHPRAFGALASASAPRRSSSAGDPDPVAQAVHDHGGQRRWPVARRGD